MFGFMYYLKLHIIGCYRWIHHLLHFLFFTWSDHTKTLEGFGRLHIANNAANQNDAAVQRGPRNQRPADTYALRWIKHRVAELTIVWTTSIALLAIAATSSFSEKVISTIWVSQAGLYASMILSFTALCKSYQQIRILLRISSCSDLARQMQYQLGNLQGNQWAADHMKIAAWQSSIVMLNVSILALLGCLVIFFIGSLQVCSGKWECVASKIVYVLLPVAFYSMADFCYCSVSMYRSIKQQEQNRVPAPV